MFEVLPNESILRDGPPISATLEVYCVGRFGHGKLELSAENPIGPDNGLQQRIREFSDMPGTHEVTLGEVVDSYIIHANYSSIV